MFFDIDVFMFVWVCVLFDLLFKIDCWDSVDVEVILKVGIIWVDMLLLENLEVYFSFKDFVLMFDLFDFGVVGGYF